MKLKLAKNIRLRMNTGNNCCFSTSKRLKDLEINEIVEILKSKRTWGMLSSTTELIKLEENKNSLKFNGLFHMDELIVFMREFAKHVLDKK
jgi:hypothetical protein